MDLDNKNIDKQKKCLEENNDNNLDINTTKKEILHDNEIDKEMQAMHIKDTEIEKKSPETQQSSLDKCLKMLQKASSDTEKFAALLMVTKLIKSTDLNENESKVLLHAIGVNFLGRMLGTKDVPEGCPPLMFKSIAVTILSCFINFILKEPALHRLIPLLAELICNPEVYKEDLSLIKNCYECLTAIASDALIGRKAFIDYEIVGSLVDAYIEENIYYENSLGIIRTIALDTEIKMWEDEPEAFSKLMNHLCRDFALTQDEQKFELCQAITDIIPSMVEEFARLSNEGSWKSNLHKGLSDILFSKLPANLRNIGLELASIVLEVLGPVFVMNEGPKGRQLLLLMVHLACIEVRMQLEDKSFQESVSSAMQTTRCYSIIEEAIKFLICGAISLEEKQKQQLYAALKGAFNGVLEFLSEASTQEVLSSDSNKQTQLFMFASIRVLCAWLAEETSANKEEVYHILPFLIKVVKHNFDVNNRQQQVLKKKNIKNKKEQLPDLLSFLLPGLCHLTVVDRPRQILLENDVETLLFQLLNLLWEKASDKPKISSSHSFPQSMNTTYFIFMNLVVLEPKRVKVSVLYYQLFKLIFTKLPILPVESQNLQLCGLMSTLGLMIFRNKIPFEPHDMQKLELSLYRFMHATVRFLWEAFNVEESPDFATLVVSSTYRDIWEDLAELWFLSMQSLTAVLAQVPWLCSFLVETSWPQSIVEAFHLAKEGGVEEPVKRAYGELLCGLVQASTEVKDVLIAKGLKNVCQRHEIEQVLKAL